MEPIVLEPINPYLPPQCDARPPSPGAMELDEPIVLRGEINLAHEVLVMRRWKDRFTKWILPLVALFPLSAAACGVYRFSTTGDLHHLLALVLGVLAAFCFWFSPWILLGLHFALLKLLGRRYEKPFWALVTNDGLRLRSSAGEQFQPWSAFSRMESAGELIMLYGQENQRSLPIVILNTHWCASSLDQDRLLSLLEAKFGSAPTAAGNLLPEKRSASQPTPPRPETVGDEPIVLSGLVGLDHFLRVQRLQRKSRIVMFVGIVLALVIILVAVIYWWSEPRPGKWAEYGCRVGFLGGIFVLGLLKRKFDAWRMRRAYASGRTRPEWTTWTISAGGVSMLTEALETHESWSQLRCCGEGDNMLVLFNPRIFRLHFLPREFATDEEWERLRMLVRQAVDRGELTSRETAP